MIFRNTPVFNKKQITELNKEAHKDFTEMPAL